MVLFVGNDWAEDHHDVEVQDATGRRLGKARLEEGVAGIARFHALVGQFADPEDPAGAGQVLVGIETDRGPWVAALVAAGYRVREVVGQPSVIFGHSYAGQVALVLTAQCPRLVRGLITGDAPLSVGVQRAHMQANREMTRRWRALAASDAGVEELAAQLRRLRIRHPVTGELVRAAEVFAEDHIWFREVARSLVGHDPDFLDAVQDRFDDTFGELIPSRLFPRYQCPVLLVQGDPAVGGLLTDEDVSAVLPLYDQIEVHHVHGVGHGLQLQAPQAIAQAIEPFLTKLLR